MIAFDGMPVMEAMAGGSAALPPSTAVRKYFPETWIWDCADSVFVSFPDLHVLLLGFSMFVI